MGANQIKVALKTSTYPEEIKAKAKREVLIPIP